MRIVSILILSLFILTAAATLRPPEYDEAYSIFLTSGDARPAWPSGVFQPQDVRQNFTGDSSLAKIAADLRQGDVHPPLYFWALEFWRRIAGFGWLAARLLSVLFALACLGCIAWAARLTAIPPARAVAFAVLSYAFAYTGSVARGFALAQSLDVLGIALVLTATKYRHGGKTPALAAGLAFGAAAFTNYLAVFIGFAACIWLAGKARQRRHLLPTGLGIAVFLPFLLVFFRAQHHSRTGQFQHFALPHAVALLAKDFGAAFFGGLPLYAGNAAGPLAATTLTLALLLLMLLSLASILRNSRPEHSLFALAALSVPAGLLLLGLIFNNTPIEIRYLAFATPYIALLLAQSLGPNLRTTMFIVQACAIAGLILAPATMQPQGLAARQISMLAPASALILLPYGNDGVGMPGPFIAAARQTLRLQLLKPDTQPDLSQETEIFLIPLQIDDASRQTIPKILAELAANPCWARRQTTNMHIQFSRICGTPLSQH